MRRADKTSQQGLGQGVNRVKIAFSHCEKRKIAHYDANDSRFYTAPYSAILVLPYGHVSQRA